MHWLTEPATGASEEKRISVRACRDLREIPGVRNCGSHIGQALLSDEIYGVYFGENWISVERGRRLRQDARRRPPDGRGLPGPLPRRADLPAGADQGGADGDERVDRRAHLRPRPRRPAREGGRVAKRDRGGRRRDRRPPGLRRGPAAHRGGARPRRGAAATASSRATSAGSPRRCWPARRSATSSTAARPTTCTSGASRRRATA